MSIERKCYLQKIISFSLKEITTKEGLGKTLLEVFAVAEGNKLVIWKIYRDPNAMYKYLR